MWCLQCSQARFTVGGLCEACAPMRHASHQENMTAVAKTGELYYAATGKTQLEDWEGYLEWCRQQLAKMEAAS